MTTVAIMPIAGLNGEKSYRAMAGDKYSVGQTAGQALDALTAQLGEMEFSSLLIIQSFSPDPWFSAEQQKRLSELMAQWRAARDQDQVFPSDQQAELDALVEAELNAATARTAALMPPGNP